MLQGQDCSNSDEYNSKGVNDSIMEEFQTDETVLYTVCSPMRGRVRSLKDVPDPAFSKGMLGEGVAIEPENDEVYAPAAGVVRSVFDTQHAIVFENEANLSILLHVGIGSMRLQGEGFNAHVCTGQQVSKGDRLLTVDWDAISDKLDSVMSPIIVEDYKGVYRIRPLADGEVSVGDPLFEIIKNCD